MDRVIEAATIARALPLPAVPGWVDYTYAALADGRLAIGRTRRDVHAEYHLSRPAPKVWPDHLRLSVFDGEKESDVVTVPSGFFPKIARLADDCWLVASSRCAKDAQNGRIYAADGTEEAALVLGDAIEHLLCGRDGSIWVRYFDEGVFAGPGEDGRWPVSNGGIVRFDRTGSPTWIFNQEPRTDRPVDDCYAMALADDALWACYYSDFPIVRIANGQVTLWGNQIGGAKAIAVDGDLALLAGGYTDKANRIAVLRLEGETARPIGALRYMPPARKRAGLIQGQGGLLHVVRDGVWTTLSVKDVASAIGGAV